MSLGIQIKAMIKEILQLNYDINEDTALLGGIPEFDSMAVVTLLTAIEEQYGIMIDDDEVDAEIFETVGTLISFVEQKV
jgi:acyl carrier protein